MFSYLLHSPIWFKPFISAIFPINYIISHQYPHLMRFITQVLQQDPRPAYKKSEQSDRVYAVHLLDFNIRWQVNGQQTLVLSIEPR